MTCSTNLLPDDIQALKALVTAQRGEIEHLKLMIAKLRRMQFGRRSEQLAGMIDQLQLTLEELQVSQAELTSPSPAESLPRTPACRKPLPAHLPREIHVHQPDAQCPGCGGDLRRSGDDIAEVLEYVPARFKVIRHLRPKLACHCCDEIVKAPAPNRPIARGLAGPGLLAHVLVSKYVDHLPLYRQSDNRIEIDNNTAERALRAVALGRKNYLFAGSDAGGERAAAIYSLVGSAKLNGLTPQAYLTQVLERIADYPINQLDDLLPWMEYCSAYS